MAMNIIFNRSRPLLPKTLNSIFFKPISTSPFLCQQPQQLITDPPSPPPQPTPISPDNWINPSGPVQSLITLDFLKAKNDRLKMIAVNLDLESIKELFSDWMTLQKWDDMKVVFEYWVGFYDKNGSANKPDLGLYNHYLRANLMKKASPEHMRELIRKMDDIAMKPNTASHNLVLKAMHQHEDLNSALEYLDGMIEKGKEEKDSKPDEESFDLVIGMLLLDPVYQRNIIYKVGRTKQMKQTEEAYKYIDLNLRSGYRMSQEAFTKCVWNFMNFGSLDTLVSVIERCKKIDKAICTDWKLCLQMLDYAMKADNSELAYYALEFMAKWMLKDENMRPPRYLCVEEGLVVSLLATAERTHSKKLLEAAWMILKRSLREKVASAETYIARIRAHASLGTQNLHKAFGALHEFELVYGGTDKQAEDLLSPFTALYPLVVASSHNGCATLDAVYYQLEKWSKGKSPYKSVAALNCIILGCANIWDADRAFQTFTAISTTFGLKPDINSYNSLICAYAKLGQTEDALKLFEQLKSLGIKANATTYALLVDAHLIKKEVISALAIIDEMVISGFTPTKEILKKVRRRCTREMDYEHDNQVEALAKNFGIRMGSENRRDLIFNLEYSAEYGVQER